MERFFAENYTNAISDIRRIFNILDSYDFHAINQTDEKNIFLTADAVLMASVEIWKHFNPWVQREYGEEPF